MSYYLSYFVSYVIIAFFLPETIDKIANNRSKTIASLENRSKYHFYAILILAHHTKEAVLVDCVVRAASRTASNVLAQCTKTTD